MRILPILAISMFLATCSSQPSTSAMEENTSNTFSEEFIAIANYADHRMADSLLAAYPTLTEASSKLYCLEALGTIGDSAATTQLSETARNADKDLSAAAIFAIGQLQLASSAPALEQHLEGPNSVSAWEALGKSEVDKKHLNTALQGIAGENYKDGMGRYLFQMAINKRLTSEKLNSTYPMAYQTLQKTDLQYYLQALIRSGLKPDENQAKASREKYASSNNLEEKLLLIRLMAHPSQRDFLLSLHTESALAAVNALRSLDKIEANPAALLPFQYHENPQVKQALSEILAKRKLPVRLDMDKLGDWKWLALQGTSVEAKTEQDEAFKTTKKAFVERNAFLFSQATAGLSATQLQLQFLEDVIVSGEEPFDTFALERYQALLENETANKERYYSTLRFALQSGSDGLVSIAAPVLAADSIQYHLVKMQDGWNAALQKLKLPAQAEAHCYVQQAMERYGDLVADCVTAYNHPINWEVLQSYGAHPSATFTTTKGKFTMQLEPFRSPSASASILELAENGFYDGKRFHRVVPSFVLQTGCPNGDGYGSVDYTIRSDFGLHDYRSGAVGMASIGKDTESCQWFVSHSHTPHLEGRYTIFAYITAGMNVIQKMGMDDKIVSVELKP